MTDGTAPSFTQAGLGPDGVRGRVVNISSQHGMVSCPGNLAYGASKVTPARVRLQWTHSCLVATAGRGPIHGAAGSGGRLAHN